MIKDHNIQAFFALLQAGLWSDGNPDIRIDGTPDWQEVYRLATEQSVLGLILVGLEHSDVKPPQMLLLQWIGEVQMIEQRNKEMNAFIVELIGKLCWADVYTLLVKGQGVAQCYEKPLWRCSGDIDLLLSNDNYLKAKSALKPIASEVANEDVMTKHQALVINGFDVELHGKMPFIISKRVDDGIDDVLDDLFCRGNVRSWDCNGTQVFLPSPDNDVIFVFTHILHHFFFEGIGLRQICDWCRLLWTYRDKLNRGLLESRFRKMGLMSEWKAFAAFAVKWLDMPMEAMPLFDNNDTHNVDLDKKADKICKFVLEVGNFGYKQRRDYSGMSYLRRKFVSVWGRLSDMLRHFQLFPKDSIVFFGGVLRSGLHAAVRGE